jgi:hypothetical protein
MFLITSSEIPPAGAYQRPLFLFLVGLNFLAVFHVEGIQDFV